VGSSQSDTVACVILCGAYVSIKSGHLVFSYKVVLLNREISKDL